MFYDAEAAVEKAVEEAVEELQQAETAPSETVAVEVSPRETRVVSSDSELNALIEGLLQELEQDVALCQADEHACHPLHQTLMEIDALRSEVNDPFGDVLRELEESAATCAIDATKCDPFKDLLDEIEGALAAPSSGTVDVVEPQQVVVAAYEPLPDPFANVTWESEPTREEVKALAEELAEEAVAEAIQNSNVIPSEAESRVEVSEPLAAALPDLDATSKLSLAKRALVQARDTLQSVMELLNDEMLDQTGQEQAATEMIKRALHSVGARMIEGVFDGERMISGEGHMYPVPPNYASKSKLVEGDMLKLTLMPDGKMIYKQIGPTARDRVKGVLSCDERGGYCVLSNGVRYKVIPASISFHRGRPGDHVVALVPKGSPSKFAAVDFIVHQ